MSVFRKISVIADVDEKGICWHLEEANPNKSPWGFVPAWSIRLDREDLWELSLLFLTELIRLPHKTMKTPGKE